jgi:hypothetical protein
MLDRFPDEFSSIRKRMLVSDDLKSLRVKQHLRLGTIARRHGDSYPGFAGEFR